MPKLGAFGAGSTKGSGFQGRIPTTPSGQIQFTNIGPGTWTVPAYVTKVNVLVMGGGGGGGGKGRNGSGGGGGGLAYANDIPVSPGASISYNVAAGGGIGYTGSASWFNSNTYLYASGGDKGTLAAASNASSMVTYTSSSFSSQGISALNPRYTKNYTGGVLGTYYWGTWTCPEGVWSISVVCVGAGGDGSAWNTTNGCGGSGGQGGALSYKNNISVTPLRTYIINIGGAGSRYSMSTGIASFTDQGGGIGGDTVFFDIVDLTITSVAANGSTITISDASRLTVNAPIIFRGTSFGGISDWDSAGSTSKKKYLIASVDTVNNTITLKNGYGGTTLTSFTPATGSMSAESTSIMACGGAGGSGSGTTPGVNQLINFKLGDGGGFGGAGGVPSTSSTLGGGGGGAGGYVGSGGAGGSPTSDTSVGGGAAITSSTAAGGGPSGVIKTAERITVSSYFGGICYIKTSGQGAGHIAQIYTTMTGATITRVSGTVLLAANTTITRYGVDAFTFNTTPTTSPATGDILEITYPNRVGGAGGGGVGILGASTTGAATTAFVSGWNPSLLSGTGGSGATQISTTAFDTGSSGVNGGIYGAGGGGGSGKSRTGDVGNAGGFPTSGAIRIIYPGSLSINSTANSTVSTVAYSATGYAGGGGGGAAGWSGRGSQGGSSAAGATANGGNGGLSGGTAAGAIAYQGGPGGNSYLGASAYAIAESMGNGAAAGGAGGINPYGGGGVGYLIQSDFSGPGSTPTTAGSAVLSGYAGSVANNGGSGGYIGSYGGGGIYGGGGPGGGYGGPGGKGFVRVIWGPGRSYPNTLTQDVVQANQLVQGVVYTIGYPGDTNWTLLGAANNASGTTFTANGQIGTGSGNAYVSA